jgi:hypothetical protein
MERQSHGTMLMDTLFRPFRGGEPDSMIARARTVNAILEQGRLSRFRSPSCAAAIASSSQPRTPSTASTCSATRRTASGAGGSTARASPGPALDLRLHLGRQRHQERHRRRVRLRLEFGNRVVTSASARSVIRRNECGRPALPPRRQPRAARGLLRPGLQLLPPDDPPLAPPGAGPAICDL